MEAFDCFEHRELFGWITCIKEPGGGGVEETKSCKEMLALAWKLTLSLVPTSSEMFSSSSVQYIVFLSEYH